MNKEHTHASVITQQLFSYMDMNADGNVFFSNEDTKFVFFVNLAIKEVIKKEEHEYALKAKDEAERKKKMQWKEMSLVDFTSIIVLYCL